jgi:ankyrin repeat protein
MEIVENRPMSKQWYECVKTAVDKSDKDLIKILMKMKFNEISSIYIPNIENNIQVIELLLAEPSFDPNSNTKYITENNNMYINTPYTNDDDRYDYNTYLIVWAAQKGYTEIVKLLLADPRVDPTINNNNAVRFASEESHVEIVKLLLNDPRVDHTAVSFMGNLEMVKFLLENTSIDPSINDNAALTNAVYKNKTEIVRLLINDPRVKLVNSNNITCDKAPFYSGTMNNEIFKILVKDMQFDPSSEHYISSVISNNNIEIIKTLLQDPNIDMCKKYLSYAVYNNSLEIAKLLLTDSRIDLSFDNEMIINVSAKGNTEIVELLLKDPRVDPTVNDNEPLKSAVKLGHYDIIKLLLNDPRVNPII